MRPPSALRCADARLPRCLWLSHPRRTSLRTAQHGVRSRSHHCMRAAARHSAQAEAATTKKQRERSPEGLVQSTPARLKRPPRHSCIRLHTSTRCYPARTFQSVWSTATAMTRSKATFDECSFSNVTDNGAQRQHSAAPSRATTRPTAAPAACVRMRTLSCCETYCSFARSIPAFALFCSASTLIISLMNLATAE